MKELDNQIQDQLSSFLPLDWLMLEGILATSLRATIKAGD